MADATCDEGFAFPDLSTFCRLDGLGLEAVGQRLESGRAVLACRVIRPDRWCRRCGCEGVPRDGVVRRLALEPGGARQPWWSRFVVIGAPAAVMCGGKTLAGRRSRGRSCRAGGCVGRLRRSSCSTGTVMFMSMPPAQPWHIRPCKSRNGRMRQYTAPADHGHGRCRT